MMRYKKSRSFPIKKAYTTIAVVAVYEYSTTKRWVRAYHNNPSLRLQNDNKKLQISYSFRFSIVKKFCLW